MIIKKKRERNHDVSIYEELYLLKQQENKKKYKENIESLVKEVFHTTINLTDRKYTPRENSEKRKTIKNGLNIIHDVPYLDGEMSLETYRIIEWIYKRMYIENVKEVNYEIMKEKYYNQKRIYKI